MNKLIPLCLTVLMSGCAGAQLEKEMKESRGYSEADIASIEAASKDYKTQINLADMRSNAFNTSARDRNYDSMKAIVCKCFKEIHDKCRGKPDGLTPEQKSLWIKSNAVDMALASQATTFDASTKIDPDTCQ